MALAAPTVVTPGDIWLLLALGVVVVPASTMLLSFGTRHLPAPDVTPDHDAGDAAGAALGVAGAGETPGLATVAGGVLIPLTVVGHSYLVSGREPVKPEPCAAANLIELANISGRRLRFLQGDLMKLQVPSQARVVRGQQRHNCVTSGASRSIRHPIRIFPAGLAKQLKH
jgi:hypothetical protein